MPNQIKMPFTVSTNTKIGVITRSNVRSVIQPTRTVASVRSIQQTNINMMPVTRNNIRTMGLPKSTGGCGCGK